MAFARSTVITSFLWKLFERLGTQLIQFVVTIVLARLLLPSDYGIIALITVFIALCNVIVDGGLNTALIQKKDANNEDFSTIFIFSIALSVLLYFIMFLSASLIAKFYEQSELVPVIRVLSLSLPFFAINSIQRAFISKNMLFKRLFYSSLGAIIISGAIGIWMAYQGYGVWALVAQSISYQLSITIITWLCINWRPSFVFSMSSFKLLFNYGWKIFCANFITALFVNARKLVIGKFYSPSSLAYYEKGEQLPKIATDSIFTSIQAILLPTFSDIQDDRKQVKQTMRRATKMNCFFIYPMIVGLIITAKPLILLLLTDKWLPAVPFFQILCISYFFLPITIANWQAIMAMGYSNITLKLELLKKTIDIIILIISAMISVFAVAWGCVLYNLICVFINLAPNRKLLNYGIREQLIDAVPTFLIALVSGIIVYWIQFIPMHYSLVLLTQLLGIALIYFGISYISKEESLMYILTLIKNSKNKLNIKR